MSDNLESLQQALVLWTNIAHKLWEARSALLPRNPDHSPGAPGDSPVFSKEILGLYDGLDSLYMEAEQKKRQILERIARISPQV
ncbi:hypothetical protein [Dehalogenimonas alkenigignens]|uniref:hypothetical protein n=1 Tax=Dehalogenimonas alkenigignens TaxID=1217799 RepID=UPI000D56D4C9|nr:hypothetical protein [Dehalogenimonas alkenigignens]PVV84370.1 hypothetical protein DD509_03490 [Dehalogenimonas alkenigignens]